MKKSLLITAYFPPLTGGISKSLYNFCHFFPSDKLVVMTDKIFDGEEKIRILTRKLFFKNKLIWPKWLPLIWHTLITIKKEKIKLIQVGQVIPIGYVALLLKKFLKIPYIVYIYGQDLLISRPYKRKYKFLNKVLKNADGIIANSRYTKNLLTDMGINTQVSIAYPCPQYSIKDSILININDFKKANNLNENYILLSVGNLVKRKGHDNVLNALPSVIKEIPNIKYIIIGNGPEEIKLRNKVKDLKLDEYVEFKKKVHDKELINYYSSCDLFIMPSRIINDNYGKPLDVEGFGMVFLEANTFGKPVIGGNNGGQTDAIENGKNGFLVDAKDTQEIALSIVKIANNPELSRQMGEYGKKRVTKNFTWKKQSHKIIKLIERI
ncbi:MAG: glycosyltransferase family 4 protein [Candidatus Helarchaeota archaeon]